MKVLFFSHYYLPEVCSSPYMTPDLLEAMAKAGWTVDFYTPTPTREVDDETRREYYKRRKEKAFGGKVTIHRVHLYREGKKPIPRALRYLIFNAQTFWFGLFKRADIVFSMSGPPTEGAVLALIHKFTHKKTVYNIQDVFPESLVQTGLTTEGSFIWRLGKKIERFTYRNTDKIVVISKDIEENLLEKGVSKDKLAVVYNWIDQSVPPVKKEDNKLFKELSIDRNKFIVTYAGNLGNAQGIETVLEAAALLKNDDGILFVIIGNGVKEEELKAFAAEKQLENVRFFPIMPAERVPEVYGLGNASVVACKATVGKASMPSKTWNIMSASTPVLASFDEDSELFKIINENECGISVPAENAEAFAKAVLTMRDNPGKCVEFGLNGQAYVNDNLTKAVSTGKYINIMREVCGEDTGVNTSDKNTRKKETVNV